MRENKDKNLTIRPAQSLEAEDVINLVNGGFDRERVGGDGATAENAAKGGFSLRDLLYTMFRHKILIVVLFLTISALTVYYVSSMPQLYGSEAKVFVRGDRTVVSVDPSAEGGSMLKGAREGAGARTEIGIMESETLAESVADKLGPENILGLVHAPARAQNGGKQNAIGRWLLAPLNGLHQALKATMKRLNLVDPPLTPRMAAIKTIVGNLEITPTMGDSMVIKVAYASHSPQMAQKILNALIDAYIQKDIEIHKTRLGPEFFRGKIVEVKRLLTAKEDELEKAHKRLKISSLDNQKALLLNQFNTFDTALKENQAQIAASKARIKLMEETRQEPAGKKTGTRQERRQSPLTDQLREQLIGDQLKLADLSSRYTDQSPQVRQMRDQIAELQRMISGQKPETFELGGIDLDPRASELSVQIQLARAELQAENARELSLTKEVDSLRKELDGLLANEKQLRGLEREVAILDTEYRQYQKSLQIDENSVELDRDKIASVTVVQSATLPTETVKPKRKLMALMGFGIFLGLAAGLGGAFMMDYCSHSLKTREDIETCLGLQVLMTLPRIRQHKPELHEEIA